MAQRQETISVVVPVLNGARTLGRTLGSIFRQQYPVEIIVIDGGSSDGTLDIIRAHESDIAYWESGIDTGISDAFNRGVSRARGNLIAILNSDDAWEDNAVGDVLRARTDNPAAGVFHSALIVEDDPHTSYTLTPNLRRLKWRMNVFHPTMFVTKGAYNVVGLYNVDYRCAMDSEWCHRAIKSNIRFHEVSRPLARMRLRGQSDRHWIQSLNEYRRSVVDHGLSTPIEAAAALAAIATAKGTKRILRRVSGFTYARLRDTNGT